MSKRRTNKVERQIWRLKYEKWRKLKLVLRNIEDTICTDIPCVQVQYANNLVSMDTSFFCLFFKDTKYHVKIDQNANLQRRKIDLHQIVYLK